MAHQEEPQPSSRLQELPELRQRNRELELLNRANRAFSSSLDLDRVLTTVLEEARHLLNVTSCSIWLIDRATGDLVCRQAADPHSEIMRGWRLAPGQGIAGWVAQTGQSAIVPDTRIDERHFKGVDQRTGLENRSILSVPLHVKETSIGVIQITDTAVARFNASEQRLFESLAGAAAIAIENARLYQETARSERKHRALLNAIPDLMLRLSQDGTFLEILPAEGFTSLAAPGDLLGRNVLEVLPDEVAQQKLHSIHQALRTGQIQIYEYQLEVEGSRRDYEARVVASGDDEALAIVRDITRRKQTEAAVHRYAGRLKILHEIDQAILTAQSPEATARAALSHIRRLVPCQRATVIEFDRQARTARVLATQVDSETKIKTGTLIPPDLLRTELLAQGQIVIDDIMALSEPSSLHKALQAENVRAYLSIPLIADGDLMGALNIGADRPGVFESRHVDIAREAASSLAVAIRHARLNEQIRQDAETKAVLVQEINHRVKNNLSAIIGLLYTEQRYAQVHDQAGYQALMQSLINRIQGLATVHQLLSTSEWSPLLLSELAIHVIHAALQMIPSGQQISVDIPPSQVRVSPRQANSLALVVNELVSNTIQHALTRRKQVHIIVHITSDHDTIHFRYQDDGPGYPPEVVRLERHNVGLYLVGALVRDDLRGELVLDNEAGAVTTIHFKRAAQDLPKTSPDNETAFPSSVLRQ